MVFLLKFFNRGFQPFAFLIFYKSEKSEGILSMLSIFPSKVLDELLPNILFQISSIFSNILFGSAYFSTSSHNNLHKIGKIKIVRTVTTIPITAYLIVFIAGLILSSFPHDKIKSNPHHKINIIEKIHEAKTNNEIHNKMKSPKAIVGQNTEPPSLNAYTVSIIIKKLIINPKLLNLIFYLFSFKTILIKI
jgi:hypothetical protein